MLLLFHLGYTLIHIITDNSNIIKEDIITDSVNDTHLVLRFNKKQEK